MISRRDFPKNGRILFSDGVFSPDFESRLAKFCVSNNGLPDSPILMDFQNCSYLDISVLINFTAFFMSRKQKERNTFFGIPRERKVRDFLRVWRYPEAFADATNVQFKDILLQEDLRFIGEPQITYTGIGSGIDILEYNRDWKEGHPHKRNFFEFTSFVLKKYQTGSLLSSNASIPREEGRRWNGALIREVLNNHLAGSHSNDDIARVVIYESIANAVRHPNATIIQAVSKFESNKAAREDLQYYPSKERASEGYLRICIWDDGESIVDTLKRVIHAGKPVRSFRMPAYMYDSIFVSVRNFEKKEIEHFEINQGDDPQPNVSDHRILLSSLFPGITRDVADPVEAVEPFEVEESNINENVSSSGNGSTLPAVESAVPVEISGKKGMGLYALVRTVLDSYQGSLFIRTSRQRLSIDISHDVYRIQKNAHYKCKITLYPDHFPKYKGNLLIISIPIKTKG